MGASELRERSEFRLSRCLLAAALVLPLLTHCSKPTAPVAEPVVPAPSPVAAEATKVLASSPSPYASAASVPPQSGEAGASRLNFPVTAQTAREFSVLSDADNTALKRLTDEFWSTAAQARRVEILEEIESSFYGAAVLPLVANVIALRDETLSMRALEMLAGNVSAAILPVLDSALNDQSEEVRWAAINAVTQVRDEAVVEFLVRGFEDSSADVRLAGLNVIDEQTMERKLRILARALQATHADVQMGAIDALQVEMTPRSVEVMFAALDATDPKVRELARFSIDFMVDREFSTAAEARAWWAENKRKFDSDLTLKQ